MLPPGTLIGKYVVRRKIAEGGMAEVYLCSSRGPEGFEKEVAIKRIKSFLAGDQSFVEMFIAEARLASRLNHANLVQIFDFDKHEDTYYLAMEFVRGHSLWDVRRRSKELMVPMPPTLVAHVGAEVAKGLWHAHRLSDKGKPVNLVHRDVTPHNVLLSFDGVVKLTDFGVAKHSASSTAAGVLKGKLAYMSPEQSRGEPLDARTDLFALGIVLWEMLTGGRLFNGDSDVAVLRAVQSSAIAPPSRLNPDVPEALSAVVMKALERDASLRYQNAQEMERALAGFILTHARSVDDTDLAGYLRTLYAEELAQEAAREGTRSGPPEPLPAEAPAPPREPTRPMRVGEIDPGGASVAVPQGPSASPDEDMRAATVPSPPRVIADLPASALAPAPRAPGPRPASPIPPPTQDFPAVRRPPRHVVIVRRALLAAALLAAGLGAAAVTVAVSRQRARPAGLPPAAPVATAAPDAPPPAPAVVAAPPPSPATEPAAEAVRPETEETSFGTLVVRVRPYASVTIDGKRRKDAQGAATFKLPPGVHRLRLEHPRGSRELPVTIQAGKETLVEQSFLGR